MFTGLVEAIGRLEDACSTGSGMRLTATAESIASRLKVGDSVAVNGCCLTVVGVDRPNFAFDAGPETLARTNLGRLAAGDRVNLETSLRWGDELGGHLVTGHIDALGEIVDRTDDGPWATFWIAAPRTLMRQMASKGSIAVDGVSLTLVDVACERFSVALIPHTLQATTLGERRPGDRVNLETDLIAKYVERQLAERLPGTDVSPMCEAP